MQRVDMPPAVVLISRSLDGLERHLLITPVVALPNET